MLGLRLGPKRQYNGLSRCHGWIGATDVWDQFFGHFEQKFEGFLKIWELRTEKLKIENFAWPVEGLVDVADGETARCRRADEAVQAARGL